MWLPSEEHEVLGKFGESVSVVFKWESLDGCVVLSLMIEFTDEHYNVHTLQHTLLQHSSLHYIGCFMVERQMADLIELSI